MENSNSEEVPSGGESNSTALFVIASELESEAKGLDEASSTFRSYGQYAAAEVVEARANGIRLAIGRFSQANVKAQRHDAGGEAESETAQLNQSGGESEERAADLFIWLRAFFVSCVAWAVILSITLL